MEMQQIVTMEFIRLLYVRKHVKCQIFTHIGIFGHFLQAPFLGGLSVNHYIQSRVKISYGQFGTLHICHICTEDTLRHLLRHLMATEICQIW